ncbi:MAG TPA: DUF362 domain-containing protein [Prolixibacteraceae bacterium]|nr:DUF362 domain-containing protein [Prolixibacteraceae bacterium]
MGRSDSNEGKTSPKGIIPKLLFIFFGLAASIWVLFRLIPKPSRANYPCMKVAFPVATSFVIYVSGMVTSVYFFKKAGRKIRERRLLIGLSFLFIALMTLTIALFNKQETASAHLTDDNVFVDPLGPNKPIGEAKGVVPGRVVWVHNPDATNENCTNASQSDAYWLSENCSQTAVDQMFSAAIKKLTEKDSEAEAWDAIFRYFNLNHNKGDVGYKTDETIFIKVNAVTAYSGATSNGGKQPSSVAIEYDTTPETILSMLRHLVNVVGVPQKNIYVGDPIADLWDHMYQYFHAEFPDINYVTSRTTANRYRLTASKVVGIDYSDRGKVMTNLPTHVHSFFQEMMDADYLINIPVMKGHRWGGVTFCAKNHFGSNTSGNSWQLHKGLMDGNDSYDEAGRRYDYRLYRVFVDLMGNKYLGGNTLIYYIDALFSTSHEHQKPQKFQSSPFNNDWSSSIILSLDPVAIESVALDLMQKEFPEEDLTTTPPRYAYVMWAGIDDYLHQAASSDWWPEGITYDPENDGTPIGSLGVHEHWNNTDDMKYSRNLGTGNGIDLQIIEQLTPDGVHSIAQNDHSRVDIYPNPVSDRAVLKVNSCYKGIVGVTVYTSSGKKIKTYNMIKSSDTDDVDLDLSGLLKGHYIVRLQLGNSVYSSQFAKI